jgi:hypothetical protein
VYPEDASDTTPSPLPTFAEVVELAPDAVILVDAGGSIPASKVFCVT